MFSLERSGSGKVAENGPDKARLQKKKYIYIYIYIYTHTYTYIWALVIRIGSCAYYTSGTTSHQPASQGRNSTNLFRPL